jgi:high-affinity Fe2+/Pb2+ permease
VRFTAGFFATVLTVTGGKNNGRTVGLGEGFTFVFLGAWLMVFLVLVLPLRASIII